MARDNGMLRGLADWLTGGLSARLDFLERDVDALQRENKELAQRQEAVTHVLADHHQKLHDHAAQLRAQTDQMIALRKMHAMLSERVGQPFPGKDCPSCGSAMLFKRAAEEKAYALTCASGCTERLLLPEAALLETFASHRT